MSMRLPSSLPVNSIPETTVTAGQLVDPLWVDEVAARLQLNHDDTSAAHAFANVRLYPILSTSN